MKKGLVSLIMPTYQHGQFIKEALEGIFSQTYPHWELIIVHDRYDNEELDQTEEIIKKFMERDPTKIRYIKRDLNLATVAEETFALLGKNAKVYCQRMSVVGANNVGFQYSNGEFEAFICSDDVFLPVYLETLVKALNEHPEVGYVYADQQHYGGGPVQMDAWYRGRFFVNYPCGICFLFRRTIREEIGGLRPVISSDLDFVLRCEELMDCLHLPVVLGSYRWHDGSLTRRSPDVDDVKIKAWARQRRGMV